MKTVYDVMDRSEEGIVRFDNAVSDACASKFIVAEKRISEILQAIAGSVHLYGLLSECAKGFDFQAKTEKLISGGGFSLTILERRQRIAYVFALLYSFDTRVNELLKFIQRFYGSNNVNAEYAEFCRKILMPFRDDVLLELADNSCA